MSDARGARRGEGARRDEGARRYEDARSVVFGGRLRAARRALGWTQAGLARHLGVGRTYLALVEGGRRPLPAAWGPALEALLGGRWVGAGALRHHLPWAYVAPVDAWVRWAVRQDPQALQVWVAALPPTLVG